MQEQRHIFSYFYVWIKALLVCAKDEMKIIIETKLNLEIRISRIERENKTRVNKTRGENLPI